MRVKWDQGIHVYPEKKITKGLLEKFINTVKWGLVPWITHKEWMKPALKFPRIMAFFDIDYENDVKKFTSKMLLHTYL